MKPEQTESSAHARGCGKRHLPVVKSPLLRGPWAVIFRPANAESEDWEFFVTTRKKPNAIQMAKILRGVFAGAGKRMEVRFYKP